MDGTPVNPTLVTTLVVRVQELYGPSPSDLERMCWTVVHEHHHGTMPSEYDIREVDEDLYLAVLTAARS
ncbi:hypothetical protein MITS9508_00300 [Synechococcus sp. MIT S9508]|uniref:hypothetical protein n=1 Tax=Synechococcus sp. MIT S9508 TaxID=1801629 RepID=UPI0007BB469F|nr:hypothetical protein MITS9508_00300 [Synechococcus sp. MIT S9508]